MPQTIWQEQHTNGKLDTRHMTEAPQTTFSLRIRTAVSTLALSGQGTLSSLTGTTPRPATFGPTSSTSGTKRWHTTECGSIWANVRPSVLEAAEQAIYITTRPIPHSPYQENRATSTTTSPRALTEPMPQKLLLPLPQMPHNLHLPPLDPTHRHPHPPIYEQVLPPELATSTTHPT